jgi:hypothetical protein
MPSLPLTVDQFQETLYRPSGVVRIVPQENHFQVVSIKGNSIKVNTEKRTLGLAQIAAKELAKTLSDIEVWTEYLAFLQALESSSYQF